LEHYGGVSDDREPVVAPNGETIDISVVPQHASLEGFTRLFAAAGSGNDGRYQRPKIRLLKTSVKLTVRSGEWLLINSSILREPVPAMEFFLMRATALPTAP
jgi:hypothetical protein